MFKFNPLTGQLDQVGIGCKDLFDFYKVEVVADSSLVSTKTVELGAEPITNSETFFLNGMAQGTGCYTIAGTQLIIDASFPLLVGDDVFINFVAKGA